MKFKIPTEVDIKPFTEEETALDSLKANILNALTEVNYSLIPAGKTPEATVVIGLPYSGKSTFLNALENNLKIIENGQEINTIQSIFEDFNVYTPLNYSKFLDNNYEGYIKPYSNTISGYRKNSFLF
ncbi:hypothetical protein [Rickettsia montanensis]|uniref:Uncharacterized protein n=1 Tax=Rickettsia montanensis (strain OSU 85-930) TaxID=1105114 RepID=H8KCB8_RICMS|nr:hypothetical protein [Rickettsia montanensis]AFC73909.1 hypothetical protein MCI_05470 [Rickettsia montanensis str. OSU 85-930]